MDGHQKRRSPKDGIEDFPTPPWATRAFVHHCLGGRELMKGKTVWEPCANRGYMVRALEESFFSVLATDVVDYGMGFPVIDFMTGPKPSEFGMEVDWIITNPPFNIGLDFMLRALESGMSTKGVAILIRSNWTEGLARYERLFSKHPPTRICQYVERVPIVRGRVDGKISSNMPYAWFVWEHGINTGPPELEWIPPCRKEFELDGDYAAVGVPPEHFYQKEENDAGHGSNSEVLE